MMATAGACVLRDFGVGFYKTVSEFLLGEIAIGPGDDIKGHLGKAAQDGSTAPVAVVNIFCTETV